MRKKTLICIALVTLICSATHSCKEPEPNTPSHLQFAKGADISWVTEMEDSGIKFYNNKAEERECTALMKELGMNAIRLRVWVDPKEGWCGKDDLLIKARRAKALGMRLMIDFHYSDWWADPGKQNKPAAWADLSFEELKNAVATHTQEILLALKAENITPEWVQIGNETADGMLWEEGRASKNMSNYAELNNAGYDALKEIFPNSKAIIHIHNGWDKNLFNWIFDGLRQNKAKWDVIGMSLYPNKDNWLQLTDECIENARQLIAKYDTEIMICEVGMSWDEAQSCKSFLTRLINKANGLPGNTCLGVFYWEPQSNPSWNHYTLGAFDKDFKPTIAMDAFRL